MEEQDEVLAAVKAVATRVDEGFARVDQQFAKVDQQFARVDQQFAQLRTDLDQVKQELGDDINQAHILIEDLLGKWAAIDEGVTSANEKLDAPSGRPLEVRVSALEVRVTRLEKKRRN